MSRETRSTIEAPCYKLNFSFSDSLSYHSHALQVSCTVLWSTLKTEQNPRMSTEAGTQFFTATSAYSLAFVSAIGVVAYFSANVFLPKRATWLDRFTWIWMVLRTSFVAHTSQALMHLHRRSMPSFTSHGRPFSCTIPCLGAPWHLVLAPSLRWVRISVSCLHIWSF